MAALRGQRLGAASSQVASLAGHVARRDLPLAAAEAIFEAQIEGGLRFGRWLWAVDEASGAAHDASRERWAQLLLGLPPWRGRQVALGELGWVRSGAGTAAEEVAARRASLWALPDTDLYREVFLLAHGDVGRTWAQASLDLILKWSLPDWPVWLLSHKGRSLEAYKADIRGRVDARCLAAWVAAAAQHVLPLPYTELRPVMSHDVRGALGSSLGWELLVAQRSLARLRGGFLSLGYVQGRQSWARRRSCVLCGALQSSLTFHILSACPATVSVRAAFWRARGVQQAASARECAAALLGCGLGQAGYAEALLLAAEVERGVDRFWASSG